MSFILLTYDLSSHHTAVKDHLKSHYGYLDNWGAGTPQKRYYLPNTCLWKANISSSQAVADIKDCIKNLGLPSYTLERCIAVDCKDWNGIEGKPF